MEKFFNTAGPVREDSNYMIDPLKRINKDEIMTLIEQKNTSSYTHLVKREKLPHSSHCRTI